MAASVLAVPSTAWARVVQASDSTPTSSVTDATSAPNDSTASVIAQQFGHPVVSLADTTETSQVSAQPDGTLEMTESSEPVRVELGGSWEPIDTNLDLSNGVWAPQVTAAPVAFSNGGSGPLVQVQSADGSWLSEYWPAGALPAPTVVGATATYPNVYPGVDLELTATSTGLTSVLAVENAAAAADPGLAAVRFAITGASVSAIPGTGVSGSASALEASDGLASASPSWWDSAAPGSSAAAPGGVGITEPAASSTTATSLTLNVASIVDTPGLAFPVYVDPDWTGKDQERTFVDSAYPTQSYWNGSGASDAYQHVGYVQAAWSDDGKAHTTQAYWQMNLSGVQGKKILKATFNTDEVYSSSCNKREVDLWTFSGISSATTWDNHPKQETELDSSNVVAYGYDSDCPAHSVGFAATSGVADAVAAGDSDITLGLRAADETDTDTWKKFDAATTLTVDYASYPSVPSGLRISSCQSFVCSSPAYINDTTPTLTAQSTDADSGSLNYTFDIYKGQSASPAAVYRSGTGSATSGESASFTTAALPQGAYEFRVISAHSTNTGGDVDSGASAFFKFTVDTTAPAAPAVTASGGLSMAAASPAGTVGVTAETVTISPGSTSDDAWGYAYTIVPSGAKSPSFPANLTCNTSVAGYTTVCPGAVNSAKSVEITAPDDNSTFAAVTFDAAGNTHGPASSAIAFYARADSTSMAAGHSWSTDTASSPCPGGKSGPVADSATASPQSMSIGGSACWGFDADAPDGGNLGSGALQFDGSSTGGAATAGQIIDSTKSYTVAAWVYPTSSGSGYPDAMGQNGSGTSAFYLQENGAASAWQFCVTSNGDSSSWQGACADTPAGAAVTNQWEFVVGQYNATDHTVSLRLSDPPTNGVGGGVALQTPIVSSIGTSIATNGAIQVGRAEIEGAYRTWTGEVLDPVAVQGIADTNQLYSLMQLKTPATVGNPS